MIKKTIQYDLKDSYYEMQLYCVKHKHLFELHCIWLHYIDILDFRDFGNINNKKDLFYAEIK